MSDAAIVTSSFALPLNEPETSGIMPPFPAPFSSSVGSGSSLDLTQRPAASSYARREPPDRLRQVVSRLELERDPLCVTWRRQYVWICLQRFFQRPAAPRNFEAHRVSRLHRPGARQNGKNATRTIKTSHPEHRPRVHLR